MSERDTRDGGKIWIMRGNEKCHDNLCFSSLYFFLIAAYACYNLPENNGTTAYMKKSMDIRKENWKTVNEMN